MGHWHTLIYIIVHWRAQFSPARDTLQVGLTINASQSLDALVAPHCQAIILGQAGFDLTLLLCRWKHLIIFSPIILTKQLSHFLLISERANALLDGWQQITILGRLRSETAHDSCFQLGHLLNVGLALEAVPGFLLVAHGGNKVIIPLFWHVLIIFWLRQFI